MTYDAADGYVVAVSLNDIGGPTNNTYGPTELTWEFGGAGWSLVNTTGQVPATLSPGLVYDAKDHFVLLYGGRLMATSATVAPVTNQTWSYLSGTWTNISNVSTPAPFAVDFPNLVYDAADEYVVLYDEVGILGSNGSETIQTTWSFESGLWKDLTASAGTPPAFFGGMAYDAADRYVVYFGGETLADELTNATFTFVAGAWTNATAAVSGALSGRIDYGITYDDATGQVLLYGGLDQLYAASWSAWSTETWAYLVRELDAPPRELYVLQHPVHGLRSGPQRDPAPREQQLERRTAECRDLDPFERGLGHRGSRDRSVRAGRGCRSPGHPDGHDLAERWLAGVSIRGAPPRLRVGGLAGAGLRADGGRNLRDLRERYRRRWVLGDGRHNHRRQPSAGGAAVRLHAPGG